MLKRAMLGIFLLAAVAAVPGPVVSASQPDTPAFAHGPPATFHVSPAEAPATLNTAQINIETAPADFTEELARASVVACDLLPAFTEARPTDVSRKAPSAARGSDRTSCGRNTVRSVTSTHRIRI